MKLTALKEEKVFIIISDEYSIKKKTDNAIVAKIKDGKIRIISELSDATFQEILDYELVLKYITKPGNIGSYICNIDITSVLSIKNTNLKTCDEKTIISLCKIGARTKKMCELQDEGNNYQLRAPDKKHRDKASEIISKSIHGAAPNLIDSITRQYCFSYGGVNLFGWAEKVFVENFLINKST